jgi:guanylate kinase
MVLVIKNKRKKIIFQPSKTTNLKKKLNTRYAEKKTVFMGRFCDGYNEKNSYKSCFYYCCFKPGLQKECSPLYNTNNIITTTTKIFIKTLGDENENC